MNVKIIDQDLEELILKGKNKGKYKKYSKNPKFLERLADIYSLMCSVEKATDLSEYSFLRYEKLKHDYSGKSSVRVMNGMVERILFTENKGGIEITLLEMENDHYGNKK